MEIKIRNENKDKNKNKSNYRTEMKILNNIKINI